MKWLEIIHLRSIKEKPAKLAKEIKSSLVEHSLKGDPFHVQVFIHHTLTMDLSIHLQQETVGDQRPTAELGLALAEGLKEYGLVNHDVWMGFESEKSEGR